MLVVVVVVVVVVALLRRTRVNVRSIWNGKIGNTLGRKGRRSKKREAIVKER